MEKVKKIIDGDTLQLENKKFIRLAGIDTPEKGKKGYLQAKDDLKRIIGKSEIKLNPVGISYGRIVAEVTKKGNTQTVNQPMKKKGWK